VEGKRKARKWTERTGDNTLHPKKNLLAALCQALTCPKLVEDAEALGCCCCCCWWWW